MLFPAAWQSTPATPTTRVKTPLGDLNASLRIAGEPLQPASAEAYCLPNGASLRRWDANGIQAELVLGPSDPAVIEDMPVTECRALIWRVESTQPLTGYSFACQWCEGYRWNDGRICVSLGTDDTPALIDDLQRANLWSPAWNSQPWALNPKEPASSTTSPTACLSALPAWKLEPSSRSIL
jgi:hypothetical protein